MRQYTEGRHEPLILIHSKSSYSRSHSSWTSPARSFHPLSVSRLAAQSNINFYCSSTTSFQCVSFIPSISNSADDYVAAKQQYLTTSFWILGSPSTAASMTLVQSLLRNFPSNHETGIRIFENSCACILQTKHKNIHDIYVYAMGY